MNLQSIFLLTLFAILAVIFFTVIARVKAQGGELFGRPTINIYLQLIGKFCLILPAGFLLLSAFGIDLVRVEVPLYMQWIALFIFFESILFLTISLWHLGRYTKMGLPKSDGLRLKTGGIYRLSRNPMYLGLILMAIASVIYVPHPVNIISALAGIVIHHRIILAEEKFLSEKFGKEYRNYRAHTRRYL
ncbi:MAG: methyltransferase family protein [Bacteroidota bacterium]